MCEQNVSYLAKHPELRLKKFNHNSPKNYLKGTKIAISLQHVNFQKFLGGACPRTTLELSWFNQLQISSAEKNTLEKMWKLCPLLFKIFRYATAVLGCG